MSDEMDRLVEALASARWRVFRAEYMRLDQALNAGLVQEWAKTGPVAKARERKIARADIAELLPLIAAAGWQLAPVVPTDEMLAAASKEPSDAYVWAAMLEAAPKLGEGA